MDDNQAIRSILKAHARRYPLMQAGDYLKLIHQSAFGPAHGRKPPADEVILTRLEQEARNLPRPVNQPHFEPLPLGYARVHLGPAIDAGIPIERIACAFACALHTAFDPDAGHRRYRALCEVLLDMAEAGELPIPPADVQAWVKTLASPPKPLSHSDTYRSAYQPHYRVLEAPRARMLIHSTHKGGSR